MYALMGRSRARLPTAMSRVSKRLTWCSSKDSLLPASQPRPWTTLTRRSCCCQTTMSLLATLRPFRTGVALLPSSATAEQIIAAIDAAAAGLLVLHADYAGSLTATPTEDPLTPREREVLHMLAAGMGNKEIATRLGISDHTAKFHVSQILSKFPAASRAEAVSIAMRRGSCPALEIRRWGRLMQWWAWPRSKKGWEAPAVRPIHRGLGHNASSAFTAGASQPLFATERQPPAAIRQPPVIAACRQPPAAIQPPAASRQPPAAPPAASRQRASRTRRIRRFSRE